MKHLIFLFCAFQLLAGCAGLTVRPGVEPIPPARTLSPGPSLKTHLDALVRKHLLPGTGAGIKIVSLKSGETLYEYNSHLLMTPASNLKIFTAAAALAALGADYPVETTVLLSGKELYLKGCGDALLTTEELRRLAQQVAGSGLPKGEYRLIGDVSCFDEHYWGKGWMWDDEPDPDEMFITPLAVNGNAVTIEVIPGGGPGEPASVTVIPPVTTLPVRNSATTSRPDQPSTVVIDRRPGERELFATVSGSIPLGSAPVRKRLSVRTPEALTLTLFRNLLEAEGVTVRETGFGVTPTGAKVIAARQRPVAELVAAMLRDSNNLAAESLLKLMGRQSTHAQGRAEDGVKEVVKYLAEKGIPTANLVMADGSGVSRYNLTTADTVVRVLEEMYRDAANGQLFRESLAVAGRDGTLANRMVNTVAAGNVRAKTGTMSGVSALSGYVTTADGDPLAFSILIQNFAGSARPAQELQDAICVLLSGDGGMGE